MPPKKKEKKKSLKEKRREEEKLKISRTLRELLNNYVLKCNKEQSLTYPPFQDHIQNCRDGGTHLTKVCSPLKIESDLEVASSIILESLYITLYPLKTFLKATYTPFSWCDIELYENANV